MVVDCEEENDCDDEVDMDAVPVTDVVVEVWATVNGTRDVAKMTVSKPRKRIVGGGLSSWCNRGLSEKLDDLADQLGLIVQLMSRFRRYSYP